MCSAAKGNISSTEKELERIFSSLGFGMYVADKDRRILLWNRAAESILGWSQDEMLGKECKEFIAHQDEKGEKLCDTECPLNVSTDEKRTVFAGTVWAHAKSGNLVPVNVSCVPLLDNAGEVTGAVEIFLDMTKEEELNRMREDITFAVTHLLKSPLTAIKGSIDLLLEMKEGESADEQLGFLEIIGKNTDNLLELATDYLDLDRLTTGRAVLHWEPVKLDMLIDEVVGRLTPEASGKGLDLKTNVDVSPPVLGDTGLLKTMLIHLLKNAIQYTTEGEVAVSYRSNEDEVSIEVADTGIGIPEDELGNLGKRFFRASTASTAGAGGSGLGITIVKEIVAKHSGTFSVASSPGEGTTVTITFNIAPKSNRL